MDILISGASIAGPAAAFWLAKAGHRVTVLERAESLRMAGQNVDVRGPGRDVLRRMGLEDAVKAQRTGEVGLRFVDDDSTVLADFPAGDGDTGGATAEVEVLRGALARLLVDAGRPDVEYVFGDQIDQLQQDDAGVTVTTVGGTTRRFDVVIIAEGSRSRVRDRLFDDITFRELGLYTAFGTIPRVDTDDQWWSWYNSVGGRAVTMRPDNVGTTRIALSFLSSDPALQDLDAERQRSAIIDVCAGIGWQEPRLRAALATTDELYLDYLTQVKAPRWSHGRVILCGDAAWCATPISGMGTTLALTGGYVLAGEISTAATLSEAQAGYERRMRPLVDAAQKLPPGTPRLAHPRSRTGVAVLRTLVRAAGTRPARALADLLPSRGDDSPALPEYQSLAL